MTKDRFSLPKASLLTLLMTGVSATSLGISIATAQEADTVSRQKTITVTATRRDESLVDVPYNISAVTGADIEAASILDDAELLRSIPGVAVVDRGARNSGTMNSARIRGLAVDSNGLGDYAVSAVASVSTYVNDTPIFANFVAHKGRFTGQAPWAAPSATSREIRTLASTMAMSVRPARRWKARKASALVSTALSICRSATKLPCASSAAPATIRASQTM